MAISLSVHMPQPEYTRILLLIWLIRNIGDLLYGESYVVGYSSTLGRFQSKFDYICISCIPAKLFSFAVISLWI